ncbi:MAG: hypothetical protein JWQ98_1482 [Chlorobi bacterium]|nr:hypothetical protein [Chlorobiota bacterium]
MKRILPLLLLITTTYALATPSIIGGKLPEFAIEDQFERTWSTRDFGGRITVFVLSDRDGYEYSNAWTDVLVPQFKQSPVRFVPVADVQSVPGFLKGLIRGKFQDTFKYSVLLDWEGTLFKALNTTAGYPNLIIVNKDGIIQHSTFGKGTREQIDNFAAHLQQTIAGS